MIFSPPIVLFLSSSSPICLTPIVLLSYCPIVMSLVKIEYILLPNKNMLSLAFPCWYAIITAIFAHIVETMQKKRSG